MTASHGLSQSSVERIISVLRQFPDIDKAVLFGSRAKGTYRHGSDIDLALAGQELNWRVLGRISDQLDDLMLPYRFSVICLGNRTDPEVVEHIARVGIPLFQRVK